MRTVKGRQRAAYECSCGMLHFVNKQGDYVQVCECGDRAPYLGLRWVMPIYEVRLFGIWRKRVRWQSCGGKYGA